MAKYIGMRVLGGFMAYSVIVPLYPQFKPGIDAYLLANGGGHLIEEI